MIGFSRVSFHVAVVMACLLGTAVPGSRRGVAADPPAGFRAIFNGRDLEGWHGLNPHEVEKLTGTEKDAAVARQREAFPRHWKVEDGALVNDGSGPYACTDAEFGDGELLVEYRTVPKADSGIYIRGMPQVQIWDWNQPYDPKKKPNRRPQLGSGGLFNNPPGADGRYPLVRADRPFGEWNRFRIRQLGDLTWVWLNDQLVVDGAVLENYYDRGRPVPARGPILLQTHGGEIRWRNIFVRDIAADEAAQIVAEAEAAVRRRLAGSLALHASFDAGLDADFARGDRVARALRGGAILPAVPPEAARIEADAGRFGGAMHVPAAGDVQPFYADADGKTLRYSPTGWETTVAVWLRLDPDRVPRPGSCEPVQIVGDDVKKGVVFLEMSKDETSRLFRYAIHPLVHIWNPDTVAAAEIPFGRRPMVQVAGAPFSRDRWTHVVFTLEGVNDAARPQIGRLYIDGTLQGSIEGWEFTFNWDPASVRLVLAGGYAGWMDDVAVFDRALGDADVRQLHALPGGIRALRE